MTTTPSQPYNPWREFVENCISGDNYFRASEYREIIDDIDGLTVERDTLKAELAALRSQEPVAFMWQHDETGRTGFVAADFDRAHWAEHNPRLHIVSPCYRAPVPAAPLTDEWETRPDGVRVRKDRWEWGMRRIVVLLWGNRTEFEVDEVVEAVRALTPKTHHDDEALITAVETK